MNLLFAFSKFISTDSWKKLKFSFLAYDSRLELMNNISDTYTVMDHIEQFSNDCQK